ncbi:MAG: PadR family transcriptional regulator [Bacillus sp. (in: firmicutes)]
MDNRLKGLKQSLKNTTFKDLHFTEQHQKNILEKIRNEQVSDGDVFLALMQLLVTEKNGFELAKLLRSRGIKKFEDNEGFLYTFIHRLEQKQCLISRWADSETKLYQLNDKGRKMLQKAEKKQLKKQPIFKELLEG